MLGIIGGLKVISIASLEPGKVGIYIREDGWQIYDLENKTIIPFEGVDGKVWGIESLEPGKVGIDVNDNNYPDWQIYDLENKTIIPFEGVDGQVWSIESLEPGKVGINIREDGVRRTRIVRLFGLF